MASGTFYRFLFHSNVLILVPIFSYSSLLAPIPVRSDLPVRTELLARSDLQSERSEYKDFQSEIILIAFQMLIFNAGRLQICPNVVANLPEQAKAVQFLLDGFVRQYW